MTHDILVTGVGTGKYVADIKAGQLSRYYDRDVEAITLVDAKANLAAMADQIRGKRVISHSAGFVAIQNAIKEFHTEPESITAIASPTVTPIVDIIRRAEQIIHHSVQDIARYPLGATSVAMHALYVAGEIAKNRRFHVSVLSEISQFDSYQEGVANIDRGIPTTLVQMNDDELFRTDSVSHAKAVSSNLPVIAIDGRHPDFIFDPIRVLEKIKAREVVRS
jgi:hypothetical protein